MAEGADLEQHPSPYSSLFSLSAPCLHAQRLIHSHQPPWVSLDSALRSSISRVLNVRRRYALLMDGGSGAEAVLLMIVHGAGQRIKRERTWE
jgi:hypothetical protein